MGKLKSYNAVTLAQSSPNLPVLLKAWKGYEVMKIHSCCSLLRVVNSRDKVWGAHVSKCAMCNEEKHFGFISCWT